MPQLFPWSLLLCGIAHYREAQWLCVTFLDIIVLLHARFDLHRTFVVCSFQHQRLHQVLAAQIDQILLIPQNAEHCFPPVAIWPCSQCRWFAWSHPWSFILRIVKIDPVFRASNKLMEKGLTFVPGEQQFASGFTFFFIFHRFLLSFSSLGNHFHIFWIFLMALKRIEMASTVKNNWSASCCFWAPSLSNSACKSLSWNIFSGLPRSSLLTSKSPILTFLNYSKHCDLGQTYLP